MGGNVWFTSDLHFGHNSICKHRDYPSGVEHDRDIITNFNSVIGKKDKLFILGDAAFSNKALPLIGEINGTKELIIGNHDGLTTKAYLEYFTKVHGFRQYKGFWLSHAPIHPQEMYRCRGNIHGHIHNGAATPPLPYPYYNVNVDFNKMQPVNFDTIEAWFKEKCDESKRDSE